MTVYSVLTRRNDEIELEGIFSSNELAEKFIKYYIKKHPDYAEDTHYRDIWTEVITVDERIDRMTYPVYKVELDNEDGWECDKIDEQFMCSAPGEVWDLDDEDGAVYYWAVYLIDYDGLGKEGMFELGKKLIEDYKKA